MDRIIRGANWYCEELNQWQRIEETTLPALTRNMSSLTMGGSWFELDIPGEIAKMEAEMTVNGSHENLRSRFGREPGDWTKLTYYESLLDMFPGQQANAPKLRGRVVIMKGLLTEVTQPGVKGVKASGATKLKWGFIILYHDIVDGKTIHKFQANTNSVIINGKNYAAKHNRLLRI